MLPVALALACAPSTGSIGFDKSSYKAGEVVKVIGDRFAKDNPVELTLQPPSGPPQSVAPAGTVTNGNGYFETSFTLAGDAPGGDYALQAKTDPSGQGHGGQTQPTTATATFKVSAPEGASLPPMLTPQTPPPAASTPAAPVPQPVSNSSKAALSKAIARCRRTHRARKSASRRSKRAVARRRAACVRKAKERYP